jgi:hypothetical protein
MSKKDFTKLSNEALLLEAKKQKAAFNAFKFIFGILVCVSIYLTVQKGFGVFTTLPVVFIVLIVAMKASLNSIKKEIESRKFNHENKI